MKQVRKYILWAILPGLLASYVGAVVANPVWWTLPAGAVAGAGRTLWQVLSYSIGPPVWGWLAIALIVGAVVYFGRRLNWNSPSKAGVQEPLNEDEFIPRFGADIRVARRVGPNGKPSVSVYPHCPTCAVPLRQTVIGNWFCYPCDTPYLNVPATERDIMEVLAADYVKRQRGLAR